MKSTTDLALFEQFVTKEAKKKKATGTAYAVVYTRVSSLEQFQTNGSLESQAKICTRFAEQAEIPILARFGGTYESAKSEERKEFRRMMDFIKKSNQNIKFIIVSDTDRFSRTGPNAIFLTEQLRAKGIQVVAASSPLDTSTSIGAFQQNIQLLFSHFDNQQRREKTIRGMMQKFEKGYMIGNPPIGYERTGTNGESKIIINKTGEAIRKAFHWKAEQGMRTSEIAKRLQKLGINIKEKYLSQVFRNVFYCGLLTNRMLKDKIVEGTNWEPLVSKQIFLKANEVLKVFHSSHDYHKENENTPLKNFIACGKCETKWTAYIVKHKGIYYYKCNKTGCKCNMNAHKMHDQFQGYLHSFEINSDRIAPLKHQLHLTFENVNQALIKTKNELDGRKKEIKDKLERLEERFIESEIEKELYQKFRSKYEGQLIEISAFEQKQFLPLSNHEKFIDFSVSMCQNLSKIWASSTLDNKMKMQKVLFPEGLTYDYPNQVYRTKRVNSIILCIAQLARVSGENKERNCSSIESNSAQVAPAGIEPASTV